MRTTLTSALLLVACCTPPALAQTPRPPLDKVLTRWVRAYDKGRIELAGLAVAKGKVDPLYGRGWLGPSKVDQTHRAALITLLSRAAKAPNPRAMEPVVRLASKGLLDGAATFKRTHHSVRHLANLALPRFTTTECVFLLMQTADGEFDGWSKAPTDRLGARAAAIIGLGAMRRPVVRPTLQRQIRAEDRLIRLATADALGRMAHPQALPILESALAVERDGMVLQACVQAINQTIEQNQEAVPTDLLRKILVAAIAALGRTDWRTDLEIVAFLGRVRSAMAVEPLIDILERFTEAAGSAGPKPSRRLQLAAYDTLRSLTGAILPIDAPDRWRQFWAAEKDRFVVAKPKQLEATRTAAGFFGVPVRGSNVLFLIDTSGSMAAGFMPAGDYEPAAEDDGLTRLEMARRELLKAVDGLSGDTRFNLVSFDAGVHKWRRNLVRASGKSRAALRQRLRQLKPAGATNIFGALKAGLEIKTLAYGSRYGAAVDEIFLLSDGEPTVGEVIATEAILAVIQETNRYSSVRINTLYMGGGGDSFFMRKLAEQNGGKYVRL